MTSTATVTRPATAQLTVAQIKSALDVLGVQYRAKDTRPVLLAMLEAAQTRRNTNNGLSLLKGQPLTDSARRDNYRRQTKRATLTPAQVRRAHQKSRKNVK